MMKSGKTGMLYVVATPIGNLSDMTQRAIETLAAVDVIAAEDTRHSRVLLQQYEIKSPMISVHEHNEAAQSERVLKMLDQGKSVALISDAGTPLISDPGARLIDAAYEAGASVIPIPGPSALSCMLSVAGQPVDRFCFEGFLPSRQAARRKQLELLVNEPRTLVFFESTHRIIQSLHDMQDMFGAERPCTVGRELTKRYETVYRGAISDVIQLMEGDSNAVKGEFVVVVAGAADNMDIDMEMGRKIMDALLDDLPVSRASVIAARLSGVRKKELYRYGVEKTQAD
jgi:16S rRNA (cytidine1402-2'-O)-methyltransferase